VVPIPPLHAHAFSDPNRYADGYSHPDANGDAGAKLDANAHDHRYHDANRHADARAAIPAGGRAPLEGKTMRTKSVFAITSRYHNKLRLRIPDNNVAFGYSLSNLGCAHYDSRRRGCH
jgi:hypothetical protein